MPVQRIVMPDGSTKAFRENARAADIAQACTEMEEKLRGEGRSVGVTQFKADEDYHAPSPAKHADVMATPDQINAAIARAQTLPSDTRGWEWSSTFKGGGFSDWATLEHQSRSEVDAGGDFSLHYHPGAPSNMRVHKQNFYPGPGDPIVPGKYGKPAFIITPDRNTLVELGIKDGRYFARPVWQRDGTTPRADYSNWRPR